VRLPRHSVDFEALILDVGDPAIVRRSLHALRIERYQRGSGIPLCASGTGSPAASRIAMSWDEPADPVRLKTSCSLSGENASASSTIEPFCSSTVRAVVSTAGGLFRITLTSSVPGKTCGSPHSHVVTAATLLLGERKKPDS
jgi:hypothetical protein